MKNPKMNTIIKNKDICKCIYILKTDFEIDRSPIKCPRVGRLGKHGNLDKSYIIME